VTRIVIRIIIVDRNGPLQSNNYKLWTSSKTQSVSSQTQPKIPPKQSLSISSWSAWKTSTDSSSSTRTSWLNRSKPLSLTIMGSEMKGYRSFIKVEWWMIIYLLLII